MGAWFLRPLQKTPLRVLDEPHVARRHDESLKVKCVKWLIDLVHGIQTRLLACGYPAEGHRSRRPECVQIGPIKISQPAWVATALVT